MSSFTSVTPQSQFWQLVIDGTYNTFLQFRGFAEYDLEYLYMEKKV